MPATSTWSDSAAAAGTAPGPIPFLAAEPQWTVDYMHARFCSPHLGRFLSMDPVGGNRRDSRTWNRYSYVLNNPIVFTDPTGMFAQLLSNASAQLNYAAVFDEIDVVAGDPGWQVELVIHLDFLAGRTNFDFSFDGPRSTGNLLRRARAGGEWERFLLGMDYGLQDASTPLEWGVRSAVSSGLGAAAVRKAVNLPAWKKVLVDMAHIAERHMERGAKAAGRTVFAGMNERGVLAAVRQAYGSASTVRSQGDRVLLSGQTRTGLTVEMWFNKTTNVIETAYPVSGR